MHAMQMICRGPVVGLVGALVGALGAGRGEAGRGAARGMLGRDDAGKGTWGGCTSWGGERRRCERRYEEGYRKWGCGLIGAWLASYELARRAPERARQVLRDAALVTALVVSSAPCACAAAIPLVIAARSSSKWGAEVGARGRYEACRTPRRLGRACRVWRALHRRIPMLAVATWRRGGRVEWLPPREIEICRRRAWLRDAHVVPEKGRGGARVGVGVAHCDGAVGTLRPLTESPRPLIRAQWLG